ncbi:MAG: hypothetical protein PHH13_03385 [Candidatus Peribacteraceae bacterium]|nr:hypothetical protein [Candidatus Peribacteraceae bacterium]
MAMTPERDLGGTETGQPVRNSPVPEGGLSKQADQLLAEFAVASRQFTEAQHLAGFADGVAQELIGRFGVRRLITAIVEVKHRGGTLFYDVLCALVPRMADRSALYDEIHTRALHVRKSYGAAAGKNGNHGVNPHQGEWEIVQAQVRYADFCNRRDKRGVWKRMIQGSNGVDEEGVVCHHFATFTVTDPEALITELEAYGGDLHGYYDRQIASFQALLERIRSFIGTLNQRIAQVRARVAKQVPFMALREQLDHDCLRVQTTTFESLLGQRAQAHLIDTLTNAVQQLEEDVASAAVRDPEAAMLQSLMQRVQRAVGLITQSSNGR